MSMAEERCPVCMAMGGRHDTVHSRHGNGGGSNRPCPRHDPRCLRLPDSEFNAYCDCRIWRMLDHAETNESEEPA